MVRLPTSVPDVSDFMGVSDTTHEDLRDPAQAEWFLREHLKGQPERLDHVLMVAEKVRESVQVIVRSCPHIPLDGDLAVCAAFLHDIGYSPDAKSSEFHPWDGYHFLVSLGYDTIAELIVGHSCSPEEAKMCGYPKIVPSEELEGKLVTYWDMRVKQGGELVSYEERLADIVARYGEDSLVGQANLLARPRLEGIFEEIDTLLSVASD